MSEKNDEEKIEKTLRIFFSYSYKDYDVIRPSIQQASEILGFEPVIPAELVSIGESILGKIRRTIDLSDLIIVVISKQVSSAVLYELEMAANQGKPLLVFAEKGVSVSSFITSRFAVIYFEDFETLQGFLSNR